MDDYKYKAKYLIYVLNRCVYPYEDLPSDETVDFNAFKKKLLKDMNKNSNIKDMG